MLELPDDEPLAPRRAADPPLPTPEAVPREEREGPAELASRMPVSPSAKPASPALRSAAWATECWPRVSVAVEEDKEEAPLMLNPFRLFMLLRLAAAESRAFVCHRERKRSRSLMKWEACALGTAVFSTWIPQRHASVVCTGDR